MANYRTTLAKENRALWYNIRRRVARIQKKYPNTPGLNSRIFKEFNPSTKGLSIKELTTQRRQLLYMAGLRTLTVKGAKRYQQIYESITNSFNAKVDEDVFWSNYHKLVEENELNEKIIYNDEKVEALVEMSVNGESDINKIKERLNEIDEAQDIIEDTDWYKL